MLNETQQDAFSELVNIAIGKAAATLSLMIERKIMIQVPVVQLMGSDKLVEKFEDRFGERALGVTIRYDGSMTGAATLFFEEKEGRTLVDRLLSMHEGDDWDDGWAAGPAQPEQAETPGGEHFSDSDKEAIIEVGNMLINALLGSVGNLIEAQFDYSVPELKMNFDFQAEFGQDESYKAFVIETVFKDEEEQIQGYLIMLFELGSFMDVFLARLDQMTDGADGF